MIRINSDSDPDVCRIAPKMLWIDYFVGIGHFVVLKISYSAMLRKVEK